MDLTKLPNPHLPIEEQPLETLFAMLIFGEARGEEWAGKVGVGWTVQNRATHPRWWGKDLRGVILKPMQFSCLNANDPNRHKLLSPLAYDSPETWEACLTIAQGIVAGGIPDNTDTSDHYIDSSIDPPKWADPKKLTVIIGKLSFYRLEI